MVDDPVYLFNLKKWMTPQVDVVTSCGYSGAQDEWFGLEEVEDEVLQGV